MDIPLYPFSPKRFDTPDGAMSYVDVGPRDAEHTVLFVHGTPSWSFEWRHVIAEVTRTGARCVAPDHLGFGLSDKVQNAPLAPADHARRLTALVRALDLENVTLVVHDFGGPIGLPLALDMPERIRSVVVVNSWLWSNESDRAVIRIDRLVRSALGRFLYLWLNASPRWLVPASFGDRSRLIRAVHRHYLAPFPTRMSRAALYALALALRGASAFYDALWKRRAELRRFPLSIVWGAKDRAFGPEVLARWRNAFPHATVSIAASAGHFVAEEAPDVVARAIVAQLGEVAVDHAAT